jgi:hypothetical protein
MICPPICPSICPSICIKARPPSASAARRVQEVQALLALGPLDGRYRCVLCTGFAAPAALM